MYSLYFRWIPKIEVFILEDVKESFKSLLKIETSQCSRFLNCFAVKKFEKNSDALFSLYMSCNFYELLFIYYKSLPKKFFVRM